MHINYHPYLAKSMMKECEFFEIQPMLNKERTSCWQVGDQIFLVDLLLALNRE